jgi:hypothetical protein
MVVKLRFHNGREYLDEMKDFWLLKKDSVAWNYLIVH